MVDPESQFYYNVKTREVEKGMLSPAVDRVGPFATAEEAANAPQLLAERSREWAEEDEAENEWDQRLRTNPSAHDER